MIQFNLLPDVKIQYLKTRRTRRLVIVVSTVAIAVSLFVLVVLFGTVYVFQKKNLNDLNKDISTYTHTLKSTPDLNKILTVQNQLNVLTSLHNQKVVAPRLFDYLKQVTPSTVSMSQLNVDFTQHTMTITGTTSSLDVVNTFVDTIKFTKYSTSASGSSSLSAFSGIVLSQFSRTNSGATYVINLNFDPAIFDNANSIKFTVPNIISTRSVVEQPTDLFQSSSSSSSSTTSSNTVQGGQ